MAINLKIQIEWKKIVPTSSSYELISDDFEYQLVNTLLDLRVFILRSDGTKLEITEDPALDIFSLDDTVIQIVKHPLFPADPVRKALLFKTQGSGIIKAVWNIGNRFVANQEFVSYESFFKDKYLDYFVTNYDRNILLGNAQLRIIFDSMLEYLDIIYAYKADIERLSDIDTAKSTFLDHLGRSFGFERIDNDSVDTNREKASNVIYKEILKNLFDLVKLRGTKLSYQLFFSALGYDDLVIEEFWWSKDGTRLVQLNEGEEAILPNLLPNPLVSLKGYELTGNAVTDDPNVVEDDPRAFNTPDNPYNIAQKSNYIRIKSSAFASGSNKDVLKKYLEFLKPIHIEYLPEVGIINIFPGLTDTYIVPNPNLDDVGDAPYINLIGDEDTQNADLFGIHAGEIPDVLSPDYDDYLNSNIFEYFLATEIINYPPDPGSGDTSKAIETDVILDSVANDYDDTFNWNASDDLINPIPEDGKYNKYPDDYVGPQFVNTATKAIPLPFDITDNILFGLFIELVTDLESSAFKYDTGLRYDQTDKWEGKYDSKGIFTEELLIEKI